MLTGDRRLDAKVSHVERGKKQERSLIAGGASTPFLAPNAPGGLPLE